MLTSSRTGVHTSSRCVPPAWQTDGPSELCTCPQDPSALNEQLPFTSSLHQPETELLVASPGAAVARVSAALCVRTSCCGSLFCSDLAPSPDHAGWRERWWPREMWVLQRAKQLPVAEWLCTQPSRTLSSLLAVERGGHWHPCPGPSRATRCVCFSGPASQMQCRCSPSARVAHLGISICKITHGRMVTLRNFAFSFLFFIFLFFDICNVMSMLLVSWCCLCLATAGICTKENTAQLGFKSKYPKLNLNVLYHFKKEKIKF